MEQISLSALVLKMEEVCFFVRQLSSGDCMKLKVGRLQSEILSTVLPTLYTIYLKQNLFYILNNFADFS